MFDRLYLRKIISEWMESYAGKNGIEFIYWEGLFDSIASFIDGLLRRSDKLTDETAIDHLHRSGWMQKHDAEMSTDSLSAVINTIMRDGDKTISINIYPWEDKDED